MMICCTGVGVSFSYLATTVAVSQYYEKYYAIATGFTSSGFGLGIVVFPPLFRLLLDKYGWRGSMLITAAVSLNIIVAGALYHQPCTQTKSRHKIPEAGSPLDVQPTEENGSEMQGPPETNQQDVQRHRKKPKRRSVFEFLSRLSSELRLYLLWRSYRFTLFCLITLTFNSFYSSVGVFLVPFAQVCGIDEQQAPFLLSLMGFGSLGARFISGFFVTRKSPVEVSFTASFILCSLGALCAQAQTYASLGASAFLAGFGTGVNRAMFSVLLRKIVGLSNMASGMGISCLLSGIGDLIGPILAGKTRFPLKFKTKPCPFDIQVAILLM